MKHSPTCRMAFGRKDPTCPRCVELLNGAAPRAGWRGRYYALERSNAEVELAAIAAHFAPGGPHALGKCGPVCTAFDY